MAASGLLSYVTKYLLQVGQFSCTADIGKTVFKLVDLKLQFGQFSTVKESKDIFNAKINEIVIDFGKIITRNL